MFSFMETRSMGSL